MEDTMIYSKENPFALAIKVKEPGKKRSKWLAGDSVVTNRIYAECFPESKRNEAQALVDELNKLNPGWTFTLAKFA
jgi:hypothetical protein